MSFALPVVIGNWKMNGLRADGEARAGALADRARGAGAVGTLAICPPATLLHPLAERLAGSPVLLGGQDCHVEAKGAHTGDIAAPMLVDAGCRLVIAGHSERRHGHGEDDRLVHAKAAAGLAAGLTVILCVGETEAQYLEGETLPVLDRQLEGSLPEGAAPATLILAYEPVWAIGTGRTPGNEEITRAHGHLRQRLAGSLPGGAGLRILYGGSVKAENAAEIMAIEAVDGVLVGGASLDADVFWSIYEAGRAVHARAGEPEAKL